jgi:hypothetical protein
VSVYHLLIENGVVGESQTCRISAPGGCAPKWYQQSSQGTNPAISEKNRLPPVATAVTTKASRTS